MRQGCPTLSPSGMRVARVWRPCSVFFARNAAFLAEWCSVPRKLLASQKVVGFPPYPHLSEARFLQEQEEAEGKIPEAEGRPNESKPPRTYTA